MIKIKNKLIIFSVMVAMINLLAVGCFFASKSMMDNYHHTMANQKCCSIGSYDVSQHIGYGLQYNIVSDSYVPLNVGLFLLLIISIYLQETNLFNYYISRDRYGGFKLFNKFILLFRKGLVNPKIY